MTPKELNAIAAQLAAQVQSNRRKSADVIPPGWFTVAQMCEATGTSDFTVSKHLKFANAEKRDFVVQTAKAFRRIPHYHLAKPDATPASVRRIGRLRIHK